jgi:hypothetical protein
MVGKSLALLLIGTWINVSSVGTWVEDHGVGGVEAGVQSSRGELPTRVQSDYPADGARPATVFDAAADPLLSLSRQVAGPISDYATGKIYKILRVFLI